MVVTKDDQWLIMACGRDIVKISIRDSKNYTIYDTTHKMAVQCIAVTHDGENLQTVGRDRRLIQWSVRGMQKIYDYGEIHNDTVMSIVLTPDSKFQFTACGGGQLKQWEITKKVLWRDFGEIEKKSIKCMGVFAHQYGRRR